MSRNNSDVHSLPSARGQGEPLSGHLSPPDGARFIAVMTGLPDLHYLFASDAGYGFVTDLASLISKNKSGKVLLSLPAGAQVLPPAPVTQRDSDWVVTVTNEGRMLIFPLAELPVLPKGKGQKIIQIPPARVKAREEWVVAQTVLAHGGTLIGLLLTESRSEAAVVAGAFRRMKSADMPTPRRPQTSNSGFLPLPPTVPKPRLVATGVPAAMIL